MDLWELCSAVLRTQGGFINWKHIEHPRRGEFFVASERIPQVDP